MANRVGAPPTERSMDLIVPHDRNVEAVLSELNLKSDSLDEPDFDVISYINEMFPNEQSLSNIEEVISATENQIRELDSQTKSIIRDCWQCESGGQDAVEDAMQTIKTLFDRVHDVQDRATRSEEMVHDITKDIQQLDQAKRNLTLSITTLNNLILIVNALDKLNDLLLLTPSAKDMKATSSGEKQPANPFNEGKKDNPTIPPSAASSSDQLTVTLLADLTDLLPQVQQLMRPMQEAYGEVSAIRGLAGELDLIHSTLADRLIRELKRLLSLGRSQSDGNSPIIMKACRLIDLLPDANSKSVRLELLTWFIGRQLAEYRELFEPSQPVAWLDSINRRFSWLQSSLPQFECKYAGLFPEDWKVSEQLVVQFCRQTRLDLEVVMKRRRSELTHNLLISGLQQSLLFESSLNKVYRKLGSPIPAPAVKSSAKQKSLNPFDSFDDDEDGAGENEENARQNVQTRDVEKKKEPTSPDDGDDDGDWKKQPFDGIISGCFDAHFDLYLSNVEKALQDQLTNRLIGDSTVNKSSLGSNELSSVFQDDKTGGGAGTPASRRPSTASGAGVGIGSSSSTAESGENTLSSATDLFLLYKMAIKQTLQLNRGRGLLGLVRLLRDYLSRYTVSVLLARVPGLSGVSAGSAGGTGGGGAQPTSNDLAAKMASFSGGLSSAFGIGRSQTSSSASLQSDSAKQQLLNKVGGDSTTTGTLTASQVFTILLRDESSTLKLTNDEVCNVCVVLVTASFCHKAVEDLEKRLKSEVRPPKWSSQISFAAELEGFIACRSICVHRLVSHLESGVEPQLAAMARLPWNNLVQVGDQSVYVTGIVNHLKAHIPLIRENLFNVRAAFTQICIKFAGALITRFITALYRCKPLNMFGAEQLLLDTQSLKSALNQMPTFGAKITSRSIEGLSPQRSLLCLTGHLLAHFTNLIQEDMGRAERIIKSVMLPIGQGTVSSSSSSAVIGDSGGAAAGPGGVDAHSVDIFLASFRQLLPDATATDLQKVLDMKGVKLSEQQSMLDAFRASAEPRGRTSSQSLAGAGSSAERRGEAPSAPGNSTASGTVVGKAARSSEADRGGQTENGPDQQKSMQQQPQPSAGQQQQASSRMRQFEKLVKMRRS